MSKQIVVKRDVVPGIPDLDLAQAIIEAASLRKTISSGVLGYLLTALLDESWKWSQKTFGTVGQRGPIGPLLHLEQGARRAAAAIDTDALVEELAYCQILVWEAMRLAEIGPVELLNAVRLKIQKNMAFPWLTPMADQGEINE